MKAKCHNCSKTNELRAKPINATGKAEITFVCINCGALNDVSVDFSAKAVEEDWLCLPPTGFEWSLPSGKIVPVVGDPIYVSAIGEHLTRDAYIAMYLVDPEVAYRYMRERKGISVGSKTSDDQGGAKAFQKRVESVGTLYREAICKNCGAVNEVKRN